MYLFLTRWLTFDQVWGMVSVDQVGGSLNRTVKTSAKNLAEYFKGSQSPFPLMKPHNTQTSGPGSTPISTSTNSGSDQGLKSQAIIGILVGSLIAFLASVAIGA